MNAPRPLFVERRGQGAPVVLLHGFVGRGRAMAGIAASLSDTYETLAPDLPGHGASAHDRGATDYEFDGCVDAVVATLEQAGHRRAHWLGYSMGARLALGVAVRHRQAVRSLVLLAGRAGIADPGERATRLEADRRLATRIETIGADAFVDEWLAQPLFATLVRSEATSLEHERAARLGQDAHGLAAALRGLGPAAQPTLHEHLGDVHAPTLLVAGALDERFVAHAHDLARRLPHAEVQVIPDAGHAAHVERPDVFASLVRDFLRRVETAESPSLPTHALETPS